MKKLIEMSPPEQSTTFNDCINKIRESIDRMIEKRFHKEDENEIFIIFHSLYIAKLILVIADTFNISKEESFDRLMGSIKNAMGGFSRNVN